MLSKSTCIILESALLYSAKRKEVFTSLTENDFIDPLCKQLFNALELAHEGNHTFDGEFISSMKSKYPSILNGTVGDFKKAIKEQKAKSNRWKLQQSLMQAKFVADNPSSTTLDIQLSCKDVLEIASDMQILFQPLPKFNDILLDVTTEYMRVAKGEQESGHWIGLLGFEALKMKEGDLIVLGARPSVGKTAIALECARYRFHKGLPTALICLETDEKMLTKRLIAAEASLRFGDIIEGKLSTGELATMNEAIARLSKSNIDIVSRYKQTTADIYNMCKQLKAKGHKVIFIDYLQKIKESSKARNRFEAVATISSDLKDIALELDLVIVALTQLNRDTENKRPQMHNLAESARIEQDATAIIMIDRPDKDEPMPERNYIANGQKVGMQGLIALDVVKNRNGGKPIKFYYYDFSKYQILDEYIPGTPKYNIQKGKSHAKQKSKMGNERF